jgi:arylsulfatase A-like enzyme
MHERVEGFETPSPRALAWLEGLYDAEIRFVDEAIRAVTQDLRDRSLWDDTVVVIASDHGEEFWEHGALGHGMSMEKELLFVPLIVHGAEVDGAPVEGVRISALVRNLDLAPTLLELAGIPVPTDFEGSSLVPLLAGSRSPGAATSPTAYGWYKQLRSFTTDQWHFTWNYETGDKHLYDNATDPAGTSDLSTRQPDVVNSLSARVSALEEEHRASNDAAERLRQSSETSPVELPPEIEEQLRQLGYL